MLGMWWGLHPFPHKNSAQMEYYDMKGDDFLIGMVSIKP